MAVNKQGKIKAIAADDPGAAGGDTTLPDPTSYARISLFVCTALALGLAIALNALHWTSVAFDPSQLVKANLALFAGFYAAAQVIERVLELVSPMLPPWTPPTSSTSPTAKAAQIKADRALVTAGLAALLGVGLSCGLGLFFLTAIGMHVSHTVDSFFTGITIAAGTKPLHDFISLIQNQSNPKTGTGA
ncbi:MAG TPA: hypothetical protein VG295_02615 [Solirubrobacteraceae bacterium]|jgi:hypothetical protein|nr:hypothetical protein [Solirubrobacteraceae bacterium]